MGAERKRRRANWFHRHLANPVTLRLARTLPAVNSAMVRLLGTDLLTIRIDLERPS